MRASVLLLLVAGFLAGCSDPPSTPPAGDAPHADVPVSPWADGDRIALYSTDPAPRPAAVQTCTDVGREAIAFDRTDALVPNGTGNIEVSVTNEDPAVGFQVGSRIDDGAITWLTTVVDGQQTFVIPVEAAQIETAVTGQRWEFLYRYTVGDNGFGCYTGPIFASHPMQIDAVRGPMG